jgi:hypothetical protein
MVVHVEDEILAHNCEANQRYVGVWFHFGFLPEIAPTPYKSRQGAPVDFSVARVLLEGAQASGRSFDR